MKNYRKSDYAVNKYSVGIVYLFEGQTVTITLEDYLRENPGSTELEFQMVKAVSDSIYLEQDRTEHRQNKRNISMQGLENMCDCHTLPVDELFIEGQDRHNAIKAFYSLLDSKMITSTEKRRIILYICGGLSYRQIAEIEGVYIRAVAKSIRSTLDKLKRYFNIF